MSIQISISPAGQAVLARYKALPAQIPKAIAAAMDYQNQLTLGQIVSRRLSFPRDTKPTPEGLRVITNTLRKSMVAFPAIIEGNTIRSSIGSAVWYARLHEFGGTFQVPEHTRKAPSRVRLGDASTVSISTAKQMGVLTKKGTVRKSDQGISILAGGTIRVKAHPVTFPARAYVRKTIEERRANYSKAISRAIIQAAKS